MKYIDNIEQEFVQLNGILSKIMEFYESICDLEDSELKDYTSELLDKSILFYKSFVCKNNISLDKVPDKFKSIFVKERKKVMR